MVLLAYKSNTSNTVANTGVNQMTYVTQAEKVLTYLKNGNTLTFKQARSRFGIQNLRARIFDLRQEGHNIVTEDVTFRDTGALGVKYAIKRRARTRA